ncbi:hypothetical protein Pmani_023455 [Petrolisthes manimaculis]|uniref:Uncharacterized protein n=1 Tax=Petrolisthes manimaculis TaxID=1843537 RepID=A0AAE1PAZ8_9EUCA|nr:hypothetical protein Pmani_023455 [Petrolisthes manimaculis]
MPFSGFSQRTYSMLSLPLSLNAHRSSHGMSDQEYLKALDDIQVDGRRPSVVLRRMQQLKGKAGNHFSKVLLKRRHSKLFLATVQLHLQSTLIFPLTITLNTRILS